MKAEEEYSARALERLWERLEITFHRERRSLTERALNIDHHLAEEEAIPEEVTYVRFLVNFDIPFASVSEVLKRLRSRNEKQRRVIRELTDALSPLSEYVVKSLQGEAEHIVESYREENQESLREFDKIIRKAAREGLEDDPIVRHVLGVRRAVGDTEFFRTFKRDKPDLARGVRHPYPELTEAERELLGVVVELKKVGWTLKNIHKKVVEIIGEFWDIGTYEAFRRWLKRHGVSFSD